MDTLRDLMETQTLFPENAHPQIHTSNMPGRRTGPRLPVLWMFLTSWESISHVKASGFQNLVTNMKY